MALKVNNPSNQIQVPIEVELLAIACNLIEYTVLFECFRCEHTLCVLPWCKSLRPVDGCSDVALSALMVR